jgi:hypothetical protein
MGKRKSTADLLTPCEGSSTKNRLLPGYGEIVEEGHPVRLFIDAEWRSDWMAQYEECEISGYNLP